MDRGIRNAFQRAGEVQLVLVIRLSTQGHCWILNTYNYDKHPSNQREICLRNCRRTGSDRWEDRLGFGYFSDVRRGERLSVVGYLVPDLFANWTSNNALRC